MDVSVRLQSSVLLCHLTTATLEQTADIDIKKNKNRRTFRGLLRPAPVNHHHRKWKEMLWPVGSQSVS